MKKITYLVLVLCAFITVGCNDTNVFTPTVEAVNANWDLSHYFSPIPDRKTTVTETPSFTYTIDKVNQRIKIRNSYNYQKRAILNPYISVTNKGTRIEIEYREESPSINTSSEDPATTIFTHEFLYSAMGKGTGAGIPVIIRYTFPKPELGVNTSDPLRVMTF